MRREKFYFWKTSRSVSGLKGLLDVQLLGTSTEVVSTGRWIGAEEDAYAYFGGLRDPDARGVQGTSPLLGRAISRRQFLGTSAAVGGVAITAPLWSSVVASAATVADPKPIPQTIAAGAPFHIELLGAQAEPSAITDFTGIVGGVDLLGTGTGTDTTTGAKTPLFTAIDNRFMKGVYVGVDGKQHHATFGFV